MCGGGVEALEILEQAPFLLGRYARASIDNFDPKLVPSVDGCRCNPIEPSLVNFAALPSRFSNTCRSA